MTKVLVLDVEKPPTSDFHLGYGAGDDLIVLGHKEKNMDNAKIAALAEGMPYNYEDLVQAFTRNRKLKGNRGQREATKLRNRRNNRLGRKNRRLNLRRGNTAGRQ